MQRGRLSLSRIAPILWALAMTVPPTAAAALTYGSITPRLKGDPDGAGSLPKTTGNTTSVPVKTATIGLVIDAVTRQPVANTMVVITNSLAQLAGLAVTDADGIFVIYLYDEPGLELSIPSEGVAGLSISAGDIVTIVVP